MRLMVSLTWWTKWLGVCRYRDMSRPLELSKFWLVSKEFSPTIFLLVELLWFDTMGESSSEEGNLLLFLSDLPRSLGSDFNGKSCCLRNAQ